MGRYRNYETMEKRAFTAVTKQFLSMYEDYPYIKKWVAPCIDKAKNIYIERQNEKKNTLFEGKNNI